MLGTASVFGVSHPEQMALLRLDWAGDPGPAGFGSARLGQEGGQLRKAVGYVAGLEQNRHAFVDGVGDKVAVAGYGRHGLQAKAALYLLEAYRALARIPVHHHL